MKNTAPLKVLIVGADISTLTLALMLEQAGIDYLLLEASESVPVVAGGMTLHPTVLPLLEQLSLRDDLLFSSQPIEQTLILDADMECVSSYDWSDRQTRYGAWTRFISRPEYCAMVLEKLPESKVLFNKMVTSVATLDSLDDNGDEGSDDDGDDDGDDDNDGRGTIKGRQDSILDNDDNRTASDDEKKGEATVTAVPRGVTVECADGSVYAGHLLVGEVDSEVERKVLYNSDQLVQQQHQQREGGGDDKSAIDRRGDLPARETHYHVSGITEALDPQRIPLLKEDTTELRLVLDTKSSLSWWAATLVDNRIAWQVTKRVLVSEKSSRLGEFGSFHHEQAATDAVLKYISQTMMCPLGGTMAQLISWTPPSQISCRRWDDRRASVNANSSRVLLLGEACRKVVPVLGQGPEETILDALALAEVLFALPSTGLGDIQQAFERFRKERTARREAAIDESRDLDLTLNAKGSLRKMYRSVMLNYLPKFIQERKSDDKFSYRPQANFLERVPDYGNVQPNASSYSRRYSNSYNNNIVSAAREKF